MHETSSASLVLTRIRPRPIKIVDLGEQIEQAVQGKDYKKFDELAQKLPELEKKLGPEYLGLLESLRSVNLTSRDGQEIVSMFDTLGDSCPH